MLPQNATNIVFERRNSRVNSLQGSLEEIPPTDSSEPNADKNTLWAQAYLKLKAKDSELFEKFNECLGFASSSTDSLSKKKKIGEIQQRAFQALEEVNNSNKTIGLGSKMRKYFEQSIKFVNTSKEFISAAVSANPYAALAWTGVSLLLPVSKPRR